METARSFLLLLILAILIFGVPILLLAMRLIEMISERRDFMKRAEEESIAKEKSAVEESSKDDAGEWTPAKHMR